VIAATLVLDGTLARSFCPSCLYFITFTHSFSVNRGCPDACTYEEPKEAKKRKCVIPTVSRPNRSDVSRTICRLSGSESGPIQDNAEPAGSVPNQEQLNGSDSANNLDPNALVGLDSLLQELQNPNASNNTVSTPPPDSFDFSRSPAQVGENAVQVAATALNQLSQPGAPDGQYAFAGIAFSVCPFSSHWHFLYDPPRVGSSAVL